MHGGGIVPGVCTGGAEVQPQLRQWTIALDASPAQKQHHFVDQWHEAAQEASQLRAIKQRFIHRQRFVPGDQIGEPGVVGVELALDRVDLHAGAAND